MSRPLLTIVLLLALVTSRTTSAVEAQEIVWGANGHPFNNYRGVSIAEQLDFLKQIGLTAYRVDILNERAVPRLRELVREAGLRGITVLPVITPDLDFVTSTTEELYRRSFQRAVAIVAPLKNEIRVWALGNELENLAIIRACEIRDNGERYPCGWGPAGGVSPLDYHGARWSKVSGIMRGLADGVRSVDPTLKRAMGTAGWGHIGAFERMRADGLEWEISTWHMYGQDPEWAFKILAGYGKPIWVTEFNHPGGSKDGLDAQASGLVRQMERLKALASSYRVEAAFVYELMDEPYWAPSFEATMGLVELQQLGKNEWRAGQPKPAFHAVRDYIAGRRRAESAPRLADAALQPPRACTLPNALGLEPALADRVSYAYCLVLGRSPDGEGLQAWVRVLERPTPVVALLEGMAQSSEFAARYGTGTLDDRAYVELLYRALLMREPDGVGLESYVGALASKREDRLSILRAFLSSHEFAVRHPILSAPITPPSSTR